MHKLKVYLDNCCYNRPYDDQSQLRIELETKAKLSVQQQITENKLLLASSVILEYENNDNPYEVRKTVIKDFIKHAADYVDKNDEVIEIANEFVQKGVKSKDATHLACAIYAKCDYFLTTDDRLSKREDERIQIINPVEFVMLEDANK